MDINDFRVVATVLVTLAFLGVSWWAFSPGRKKQFDDAANLPFADEDQEPGNQASAPKDEPTESRTGDDQ